MRKIFISLLTVNLGWTNSKIEFKKWNVIFQHFFNFARTEGNK